MLSGVDGCWVAWDGRWVNGAPGVALLRHPPDVLMVA